MGYGYRETMQLTCLLCFPWYAAARIVTGLYTSMRRSRLDLYSAQRFLMLREGNGASAGRIASGLCRRRRRKPSVG